MIAGTAPRLPRASTRTSLTRPPASVPSTNTSLPPASAMASCNAAAAAAVKRSRASVMQNSYQIPAWECGRPGRWLSPEGSDPYTDSYSDTVLVDACTCTSTCTGQWADRHSQTAGGPPALPAFRRARLPCNAFEMAGSDTTSVGLVQMRCGTDPAANLAAAVARIEEAAGRGAPIVSLQELFRSQYFRPRKAAALFPPAEPIPGPSTEALGRVAKAQHVVVVASLFEKRAEGVFHNTAVLINADGSIAGLYRKMHIPDDPLYYEKYYLTPGDVGLRSFATDAGQVGALGCWDGWCPE